MNPAINKTGFASFVWIRTKPGRSGSTLQWWVTALRELKEAALGQPVSSGSHLDRSPMTIGKFVKLRIPKSELTAPVRRCALLADGIAGATGNRVEGVLLASG
jgi:hypothetical protein